MFVYILPKNLAPHIQGIGTKFEEFRIGNFMYNKIFSATKERKLVIKNIAVDPKMHACTALIIFTSREESI